jgi:hypothetical protein
MLGLEKKNFGPFVTPGSHLLQFNNKNMRHPVCTKPDIRYFGPCLEYFLDKPLQVKQPTSNIRRNNQRETAT